MTLSKSIPALVLTILAPAAFACDYPQRADVANGQTASKDEMVASQKAVKTYMSDMENYLACIESEEQDAVAALGEIDEDTKKQRSEVFNKKYNAAVDEMQLVAAEFNEQVRAYKNRAQ